MNNEVQSKVNEQGADSAVGKRSPSAGWGEVTLAALPLLLITLVEGLPMLLVVLGLLTWEAAAMRTLNTSLIVVLVASLLAVFILAWRRRWPVWSASWYLFFCVLPLLTVVGLVSWLEEGKFNVAINQDVIVFIWMPLILAVLLYTATRLDPLRGLLAALPLIFLLWRSNMEFVPDTIELTIKVISAALVFLTVAFILRRDDWRTGLYAMLVLNLVVGTLFAYAGIYHGGMLPFTAPGPNLVEVMRSLIPQYVATSAILLGPLFAWRFRQSGRSGGQGRLIAYHLVLAGLLLVIMANLAGLMLTMRDDSPYKSSSDAMAPLVALGLVTYLVGVVWLYRHQSMPRTASGKAEVILLPLLPLGIPIMLILPFITSRWPMSNLYGIPLLWVLPHAVSLALGTAWLVLSVWVVTHSEGSSELDTTTNEVAEAAALGQG